MPNQDFEGLKVVLFSSPEANGASFFHGIVHDNAKRSVWGHGTELPGQIIAGCVLHCEQVSNLGMKFVEHEGGTSILTRQKLDLGNCCTSEALACR